MELRDPYANYNKITVAQLKKEVPSIDWDALFHDDRVERFAGSERGING